MRSVLCWQSLLSGMKRQASSSPGRTSWDDMLKELQAFLDTHAGCYPKQNSETIAEAKLAKWMNNQRQNFRQGHLSQVRAETLGKLPQWSWNIYDHQWQNMLQNLQKWLTDNDGYYPKRDSEDELESKLSHWMNNQRVAFQAGSLCAGRADYLGELPGWEWNAPKADWHKWFACAEKWFFEPPYSKEAPKLVYPRITLRGDPQENEDTEDDNATDDDATDIDEECDLQGVNVSSASTGLDRSDEVALARWLRRQKISHRLGRLSTEQKQALQTLPDWLWCSFEYGMPEDDDTYEYHFQKLKEWPLSRFNVRESPIIHQIHEPFKYSRDLLRWEFLNREQYRKATFVVPQRSGKERDSRGKSMKKRPPIYEAWVYRGNLGAPRFYKVRRARALPLTKKEKLDLDNLCPQWRNWTQQIVEECKEEGWLSRRNGYWVLRENERDSLFGLVRFRELQKCNPKFNEVLERVHPGIAGKDFSMWIRPAVVTPMPQHRIEDFRMYLRERAKNLHDKHPRPRQPDFSSLKEPRHIQDARLQSCEYNPFG